MGKQRTATLCGCLAAVPLLIGCANGVGAPPQAYAPPAPAAFSAADAGSAPLYAVEPGVPASILVMLPSPGDGPSTDPGAPAALGFDAMTASPSEMYRIAAEQPAALARLAAETQAIAAAPVWLTGASPAI